jgi:hypothetical protein
VKAAVGSIIAHGALIAVLAVSRGEREAPRPPEPTLIEVIVVPPAPRTAHVPGDAPGASRGAATATPRTTPRTTTPNRRTTTTTTSSTSVAELLATGTDVGFDGGGGGGDGDGNGVGGGGRGGLGTTANGPLAPRLIALPPPPKVSKARKATLIYPTRERTVENPGELFVASVDVDHEGFVVGARLKSGMTGPRHDDAAGLIFKVRYRPALDDDGRAIRSTFDQPFTVGP